MTRPGDFGDARRHSTNEETPNTWTSIARFLNAAEAGFFAYELKLLRNIPVQLLAEENFDAIAGHWSTTFVLSVPLKMAEQAAFTLQELVQRSEGEDYFRQETPETAEYDRPASRSQAFNPYRQEADFETTANIHWVPIVVTLAAGSLAVWSIKKLWEPAAPRAAAPLNAPRDMLWEVMKSPNGRKWVQHDPNSRLTRELEFAPTGNEAILREDEDGDQFFERTQRIRRP